jgi:hypothetical protein
VVRRKRWWWFDAQAAVLAGDLPETEANRSATFVPRHFDREDLAKDPAAA